FLGLALLLITAIGAPFSPVYGVLIAWRVLQAVSTSTLYPNAIGLVRTYRRREQGRFLGWIGMSIGIAAALGPTLGGLLVKTFNWRAIFFVNAPLVLIVAGLLWWSLKKSRNAADSAPRKKMRAFDWWGTAGFVLGMTAWLLWSNNLTKSWDWVTLAVAIGLTGAFIFVEKKVSHPVLPVNLFAERRFTLYSIVTVFINIIFYALLFGLPTFLQLHRHWTVMESGLLLFVFSLLMAIGSLLGGKWAQSTMRRRPLLIAGGILMVGSLILWRIMVLTTWELIIGVAAVGFSYAISNVVIQKGVIESVPSSHTGTVAGTYMLLRYLGAIVSAAILSITLTTVKGSEELFALLAVLSIVALALTWGIPQGGAPIRTRSDG
ncbi:MAG: MFS transporter, partial [Firmicutes bacterium]|nr:MFS transporter [Bacillota bacterium]